MNKMRIKLFITIILIIPVMMSLFGENHLENSNDLLYFKDIYILETDQFLTRDLEDPIIQPKFRPYDWTNLPQQANLSPHYHLLKAMFTLSPSLEEEPMALYLGPADYPYQIYINGELLASRGNETDGLYGSVFEATALLIPHSLLFYDKENILSIASYSASEKAAIGGLYLGKKTKVEQDVFIRDFWFHKFVFIMCTGTVLLFAYFLYLFMARGRKKYEYLYFALTCLSFAFSNMNIAFYYDFADSLLLAKFSRIGLLMAVTFVWFFIIHFVQFFQRPRWFKVSIHVLILGLSFVLSCITAFQTSKLEIYSFFTNVSSNITITPLLASGLIILIVAFFIRKNKQALVVAIALGVLVFTSTKDLGFLNRYEIPYYWASQYGFSTLVLCIFFVLAIKQARAEKKLKSQEDKIYESNKELETILDQIQTVSANLRNSQADLAMAINSSVRVVKDYDENNKKLEEDANIKFDQINTIVESIKTRIIESSESVPRAMITQARTADQIISSIDGLNIHLEKLIENITKTDQIANRLSSIAARSTGIVDQSKSFTAKIEKYSEFIEEILTGIEQIVERTKILAVNAAIEATRFSKESSGFHLAAEDIRKLAQESFDNLNSSFEKINTMNETITQSTFLTENVRISLNNIIEASKKSAGNIKVIRGLLQEQKTKSAAIRGEVTNLLDHTGAIKRLSQEEIEENEGVITSISGISKTFHSVIAQLKDQIDKGKELDTILINIQQVLSENSKNVVTLNKCLSENKDK